MRVLGWVMLIYVGGLGVFLILIGLKLWLNPEPVDEEDS